MKFFEIPIQDGIDWIKTFKQIMPELMTYHYYWDQRPQVILDAYSEGLNEWKTLNKIFPLCNIKKIKIILKGKKIEFDINSTNGERSYIQSDKTLPTDCIFYSTNDLYETLLRWPLDMAN